MGGRRPPVVALAAALTTPREHEDAAARERAHRKVVRLQDALGAARGRPRIGSRWLTRDPAWVTPEVVRSTLTTRTPAAGGALAPWEERGAEAAGLAPERWALFAHLVGEQGLAGLTALLGSGSWGDHEDAVPEETALLTVAWLVRAGDREGALDLLVELAPLAGRLRFSPAPGRDRPWWPGLTSRAGVAEVAHALVVRAGGAPRQRPLAAMHEAVTVWRPLADDLLELWLPLVDDPGAALGADRLGRARALVDRYDRSEAVHRLGRRHARPGENAAVLVAVTREVAATAVLGVAGRRRVEHVVAAMLARGGRPGSPEHDALRRRQAYDVAAPDHGVLAGLVAARLAAREPGAPLVTPQDVLGPVDGAEALAHGLPAGTPVPHPVRAVVERCRAGSVEDLVDAGLVPSAEVLSGLAPAITSQVLAEAWGDPAAARLGAVTLLACRRRRRGLLFGEEQRVAPQGLPWVAALPARGDVGADLRAAARESARRLGALAVEAFPGAVLPAPLVAEVDALWRDGGLTAPLGHRVGPHAFDGRLPAWHLPAAKVAAALLEGSVLQRYHGVDAEEVLAMDERDERGHGASEPSPFALLCHRRAGVPPGRGRMDLVGARGVVEQAGVLGGHDLAVLVGVLGVAPPSGWEPVALGAWRAVAHHAGVALGPSGASRAVQRTADAWYRVLFALSMVPERTEAVVEAVEEDLAGRRSDVRAALTPVLGGLRDVVAGEVFGPDGRSPHGRRLLGRGTPGRHWLLDAARTP